MTKACIAAAWSATGKTSDPNQLVLFLDDPLVSGAGFDSLRFHVTVDGETVIALLFDELGTARP